MGLFELLENIKIRPGHFLGTPSLVRLQLFLGGYNYCKKSLGLPDTAEDRHWLGFQKWVAQRYEIKSNHSWSQIIVFFSMDEFEALDNFFKLWEEFKKEVSEGRRMELVNPASFSELSKVASE